MVGPGEGYHLQFQMTGLAPVLKKLDGLKLSMKKKILRTAMTKAGRILVKEVKKNVPKEFGFARKSIISKVKTYSSGNVVMLVGPNKDKRWEVVPKRVFRQIKGKTVPLRNPAARPQKRRPVNYFHLIEQGFTHPSGKQVPAQAPLRKAWAAKAAEVERKIIQEIEAGLAKL